MIIYGIKNCNTMQKALRFLVEKGSTFEFHDYKKKGVSEEKIKEWFKKEPWEKFINKQGQTFKKLSDEEKASVTNADSAMKLMMEKTSLIKRPILELGQKLYFGFDEESWRAL
jgi:arsenate reductase